MQSEAGLFIRNHFTSVDSIVLHTRILLEGEFVCILPLTAFKDMLRLNISKAAGLVSPSRYMCMCVMCM